MCLPFSHFLILLLGQPMPKIIDSDLGLMGNMVRDNPAVIIDLLSKPGVRPRTEELLHLAFYLRRNRMLSRELVQVLQSSGLNIDSLGDRGSTLLMESVMDKDVAAVDLLLSFGSSALYPNKYGWNSNDIALVVEYPIRIGGVLSLEKAANSSVVARYNELIRQFNRNALRKEFVNDCSQFVDYNGNSPLMIATLRGHRQAVKRLLQLGVGITATNGFGQNVLHCACATNLAPTLLETIGEEKAEIIINAVDSRLRTPMHVAVERGHYDSVVALSKYGANLHQGESLLVRAVECKHCEIVEYLYSVGCILPNSDLYYLVSDERMRMIIDSHQEQNR